MAFVAFCAVGASARTSTAIDGRPWWVADYNCFTSENYGIIANSCGTLRTFRVGGQIDSNYSGSYPNVAAYGRGNGSSATSCTLIGTDQYGYTVSTQYGSTTSSTINVVSSGSVYVSQWGTVYAHCDVASGGAIASFIYW